MVSLTLSRTELPRRKDAPRLCTFTEGVRVRVWVRTDFFRVCIRLIDLKARLATLLLVVPTQGTRCLPRTSRCWAALLSSSRPLEAQLPSAPSSLMRCPSSRTSLRPLHHPGAPSARRLRPGLRWSQERVVTKIYSVSALRRRVHRAAPWSMRRMVMRPHPPFPSLSRPVPWVARRCRLPMAVPPFCFPSGRSTR